MGLSVEVKSSFGEQSARLALKPPARRLSQFGTRLALAAFAIASPLTVAPQARAEDNQPGVKPEGITIIVDGNPVDVSGVQAGGEPLSTESNTTPELDGQGGGAISPEAIIPEEEYRSSNGQLVIKGGTGITPVSPDALDKMENTYSDSGLKFIVVADPTLRQDYDEYALKVGEPVDRTIMGSNTCIINGMDPLQNNKAWNEGDCYNPNKTFFLLKPVQTGDKVWELRIKWFPVSESISQEAFDRFILALNRTFLGSSISYIVSPEDINSGKARQIRGGFQQIMGVVATPLFK